MYGWIINFKDCIENGPKWHGSNYLWESGNGYVGKYHHLKDIQWNSYMNTCIKIFCISFTRNWSQWICSN